MVDTRRALDDLQTLFADNTTGDISPQDLRDFLVSAASLDRLAWKSGTADTPDDDFTAGTLDGKWTAVSGSSGTVSIDQSTTSTEIYDLGTRDDQILFQAGSAGVVSLRQDYTLPDDASIVVAFSLSYNEADSDNLEFSLVLNDNDTSRTSGEYVRLMLETDGGVLDIQGNSDSNSGGNELGGWDPYSVPIYFRILRKTLTYSCWVSMDGGDTWTFVFEDTHATAASNIWLTLDGASAEYADVVAVRWIFQGTDSYDPW